MRKRKLIGTTFAALTAMVVIAALVLPMNDVRAQPSPISPRFPTDGTGWYHYPGSLGHYPSGGYEGADDTYALDLNLPGNADKDQGVKAVEEGVVKQVDRNWGWVLIEHSGHVSWKGRDYDTWYSGYLHMKDDSYIAELGPNERVERGQRIGTIWDTKAPDQYHLHFALYVGKAYAADERPCANCRLNSFLVSVDPGQVAGSAFCGFTYGDSIYDHYLDDYVTDTDHLFELGGDPSDWNETTEYGFWDHLYYTRNSEFDNNNWAWWKHLEPVSTSGEYSIFSFVARNFGSTTAAKYEIHRNGELLLASTLNQSQYYDKWVSIARTELLAGDKLSIHLGDATGAPQGTEWISYDTIRILRKDDRRLDQCPTSFVPIDLVLVLDKSGSMSGYMGEKTKIEGAKESAIAVINALLPEDRVAVVSFSSDATVNVELTSDFDYAKSEVEKITPGGVTSFGAGLKAALDELEARGNPEQPRAVIFMSNGWHNTSPPPESYVAECYNLGILIYTIGLGEEPGYVNEELLKWMASETGGQYLFAPYLYDLQNSFLRFSLEVKGFTPIDEFAGWVSEGETVTAGTFEIAPGTPLIRVTLNWPGSDLDLVLTRPDGTLVDLEGDPDVEDYSGAAVKPEWVILGDPQPGIWTVQVFGKVITSPDEQYIVWVSGYTPPAPPTVQADIDLDPDTLNLKSKGRFVTVYIELPEGYDVHDIDIGTVMLNDTVLAENDPKYGFVKDVEGRIGDYDDDGLLDCMVKFDRDAVQGILDVGEQIEVTISGEVGGIAFEGSDIIRVINE